MEQIKQAEKDKRSVEENFK